MSNPYGDQPEHNPFAAPSADFGTGFEAPAGGVQLASRGQRFAEALIDGLILMPFAFGVGLVWGIIQARNGVIQDPDPIRDMLPNFMIGVVATIVVAVVYLAVNGYLLAKYGQTVGKKVVGTRIVDEHTNQILPLGPLFLKRWASIQALGLIPIIGGFIGLVDAVLIFRANHKCLHDDFAGTKVIKV